MKNTKRYWLSGGIIALIIGAVYVVIYLVALNNFNTEIWNWGIAPGIFLGIMFSVLLGCDFWGGSNVGYCETLQAVSLVAVTLIIYFIGGMFLGWLYGKIKIRNKPTI